MKRFDFAAEVSKQLITISSAFIAVVIAFYEKFFTRAPLSFFLVLLILTIFIASIICGVLSLGGIVSLIEKQERKAKPFVSIFRSQAELCAQWQQGLFAVGLILFIIVALIDQIQRPPVQSIWG